MDTNEDWYLEASIGSESPAPPRVRAPASERILMSLSGPRHEKHFWKYNKAIAKDLQWETLNLIIREHRQQTAQLAWLFICTQTQYLIIMNWTNDKYLFSPSVESRGHPRQCAFITFSSVKLFSSECLKNILIAIVYLQFWCACRSYLSSDQPPLWQ